MSTRQTSNRVKAHTPQHNTTHHNTLAMHLLVGGEVNVVESARGLVVHEVQHRSATQLCRVLQLQRQRVRTD